MRRKAGPPLWLAVVCIVALALYAGALLVDGCGATAHAQGIAIPNTFVNGTAADANAVNANFTALAANALNRTAGVMTGTLTSQSVVPSVSNTYDLGSAVLGYRAAYIIGNVAAGSVTTSGPLYGPNGSAGVPTFAFTASTTSGLYSSGTNAIDFATNSIKALGITSLGVINSPTQFRAVAYHNSVFAAVPNATLTAAPLNAEDVDVGGLHDTVTNNSRIIVPTGGDGFYVFIGKMSFTTNATGRRVANLRKNGATVLPGEGSGAAEAGGPTDVLTVWAGTLVAADYIELCGTQDSGGALDTGSATKANANFLIGIKLW